MAKFKSLLEWPDFMREVIEEFITEKAKSEIAGHMKVCRCNRKKKDFDCALLARQRAEGAYGFWVSIITAEAYTKYSGELQEMLMDDGFNEFLAEVKVKGSE